MVRSGTVTRRSSAETREHVLEVAHDLFYWQGIRAVGVDRIAAEAGVAPTTLYRLWTSKDDLVAAYVERADRGYREWFDAATAHGTPRERILSLFDALAVQTQPDRCRGCPFQMALTEFPDPGAAVHRNAAANKAWVRARLGELTAGMPDPEALGDQLALLIEGVYASAQALGAEGPAEGTGTRRGTPAARGVNARGTVGVVDIARDRDPAGRPRNARPRDASGRPLPRGAAGVERVPDDLVLTPDEGVTEAQRLIDAGLPFPAHDVLEAVWKSAPDADRELWRGLAQLAVGLTHAQRGNARGAAALLHRAAHRIGCWASPAPAGLDIAGLQAHAEALARRIEEEGLTSLRGDDLRPRLRGAQR